MQNAILDLVLLQIQKTKSWTPPTLQLFLHYFWRAKMLLVRILKNVIPPFVYLTRVSFKALQTVLL
ncbi:hypothetical protein DWQ65_07155 [Treponema phagedenis]|uniref:Uncharacterized protein n=1 Tax=Treponema phagedenis TaxID=162 RepID=A0A0B7GVR8_TREPH|nr:hypothetical protein C5O78_10205 [Treponema phagedenis]QSH99844.1 hypothetical protein DWQ65_07155 [Treponema phagedenis]CEM62588.1 hypothetical protein TPHV1_40091 [Treponema phagedenis]